MNRVTGVIREAQERFRQRLERLEGEGGLTEERYAGYLSMQYHLTKGVQRHFLAVAGHPDLAHRRSLRKFLVNFADEEELHFEIAERDLAALGLGIRPAPLDVKLWWAYFDRHVQERPFLRLGATCVLENIATEAASVIARLFAGASYLNPRNTRFFTIHQHGETLPHGDQIVAALVQARLTSEHLDDVYEGAATGMTLYLRMVEGVLAPPHDVTVKTAG